MGLLDRANNNEDAPGADNEELYRELFAKIGRDFVYKEDLEVILRALLVAVNPLLAGTVNLSSDVFATRKAREYKKLLDNGDTDKKYKDLINMDED